MSGPPRELAKNSRNTDDDRQGYLPSDHVLVGYGRSPERALFWSTSVVLLGMVVFRPHRMEPRTTNLKADHYSALWYSIDLFLPLIKLQDAELWKPRDEARFARFWSRFHTMLGWALIPIAVAAWTGMLEK